MYNSPFNIAIVGKYPFPHGMAATNRIITYSKGLIAGSVGVTYYACLPPTRENLEYAPESEYEGIRCIYSMHRTKGSNRFTSLIVSACSILLSMVKLVRHHRKSPYRFLFISDDSTLIMVLYTLLGKLLGIKMVFIGDEYPSPMRTKFTDKLPVCKVIVFKIIHFLLSCRVLMTKTLREFYDTQISLKPTHILPSIVDIDRFDQKRKPTSAKQLCYMGGMDLTKDNVDNIVRAMPAVLSEYPDLKLSLYGTPPPVHRKLLEELIASLGLEKSVFIKPRVNFDDVPRVLGSAHVLVTSQQQTKRIEGGFSTKIGEYMISGTPALFTHVGEIGNHIIDGHNGFLVEPDDPSAYATKLRYIIENYDKALQVAERGKQYVIDNFGSTAVARELKLFLENV